MRDTGALDAVVEHKFVDRLRKVAVFCRKVMCLFKRIYLGPGDASGGMT